MQIYFIAIVLPEELDKKVLRWKKIMNEKFGCKIGLKSPAHITLIPPFRMQPEKEYQLTADIDAISLSVAPFIINTRNFSAFRPRTIFIDVLVNAELRALKVAADELFSKADYKINIDTRPFHPHITIATRDLHKKIFHEAWAVFESKKFVSGWKAAGLSLLRHNSKSWEVVYTSAFRD